MFRNDKIAIYEFIFIDRHNNAFGLACFNVYAAAAAASARALATALNHTRESIKSVAIL